MVQYMMRVGMAAGFFLFLNVWERVRARRSHDAYVNEMENGPATPLDQLVNAARQKAAASPLLNVKNFSLENLEGAKAPANSLQ